MKKKVVLIVLDSVGIGELPDAALYDDVGADTLGHVINRVQPTSAEHDGHGPWQHRRGRVPRRG